MNSWPSEAEFDADHEPRDPLGPWRVLGLCLLVIGVGCGAGAVIAMLIERGWIF